MLYDIFISHASEDKKPFVRSLANALQKENISVWYDEFSLKPGDSLRRSIDVGLLKSRFGIVVLSKAFFGKAWPEWELEGLIQRQTSSTESVIIPIWLNVDYHDVLNYSPSLANIYALRSSNGLLNNVNEILKMVKPQGSSLVFARDRLIKMGYNPPVVTDDWWHKAIEYSSSNDVEGTFQEAMGWGRWGFPLPERGKIAALRGERIAWSVLQVEWMERAEKNEITQITEPEIVHDFIKASIGLSEKCHDHLQYLAAYAPQLTIKGFGGEFEQEFDNMLYWSQEEYKSRKDRSPNFGSGLTTTGTPPSCDEFIALRDDNFGFYEPEMIACTFVQSDIFGPPIRYYDHIDYLVWMISDSSLWLPSRYRIFLIEGMKRWAQWPWDRHRDSEFQPNINTGTLYDEMLSAISSQNFKISTRSRKDLESRIRYSINRLHLKGSAKKLAEKFIEYDFIDAWIHEHGKEKKR